MSYQDEPLHDLTKLLRCKRYEQPPPGFFLSFSDKVIARIEAEDAAASCSWWDRLMNRFDARPVFVCAYSLAVSSLLFLGFKLSQAFEAELAAAPVVTSPWLAVAPGSPSVLFDAVTQTAFGSSTSVLPLTATRAAFTDEPSYIFNPGPAFHLQPAGFGFNAR